MLFFDNIIFSLQKAGGISAVWQNLISEVIRQNIDAKFIEYPDALDNIFRKQVEIAHQDIINTRRFNRILSQFQKVDIREHRPFIFHSSYFRLCSNPDAITVTTLHDFTDFFQAKSVRNKLRLYLNKRAISHSDAVVCVSENTKNDLLRIVPDIDPSKIHVIYNGVSDDYRPIQHKPYDRYRNSVLFIGGRSGYKNFEFVVKALSGTDYRLLICGAEITMAEKKSLDTHIPGRYDFIKHPDNTELNRIYNSVHCLAYPSSYEGFGIPVLEAQRAGCPVIALKSSSIPEVMGNTWGMMDRLDESEFKWMLSRLHDTSLRNQTITDGLENSKRFSWEKMANDYICLYNRLLNIAR